MIASTDSKTEQWGTYELALKGPSGGNPFVDVQLGALFTQGDQRARVTGFYDGDGTYRIRCMPPTQGLWEYQTQSNRPELNDKRGSFTCTTPSKHNHGPVRVANTFHFAYADGTPYRQIGTTCYAWVHQGDELEEKTLATLTESPFNKIRMCVFPKWYAFNQVEPKFYAFEGSAPDKWDFTRFNPAFWHHLEKRIGQLRDMNIEADLILFHPYDQGHWGFDRMPEEADDRYLKYCVSRLASFRNVWWSMANEWDFMKTKRDSDWDRYFQIVRDADPYDHLRGVHNGKRIYDHNKSWVTHASVQNGSAVDDFGRAVLYRDVYYKPIVFDEVEYEGDIPQRWGDLTPEQMTMCFWHATVGGTYCGHGETYQNPQQVLWWSKGGVLHGKSPARIAFLRKIMHSAPASGINPIDKWYDAKTAGKAGQFYLIYFGNERPTEWLFELPKAELAAGMRFKVDVLDTWDMSITPVPGEFKIVEDHRYRYHAEGLPKVKLPGKPWMAIRVMRIDEGQTFTTKKRSELAEEMTA